jgi:hypothetical protein
MLNKKFKKDGRGPNEYDCYGYIIDILKKVGKYLPEYDSPALSEKIIKIDKPESFCIVEYQGFPTHHVGIVLEDCIRFIHIRDKVNVAIERLDQPEWQRKIIGFYRCRESSL